MPVITIKYLLQINFFLLAEFDFNYKMASIFTYCSAPAYDVVQKSELASRQ
jgi:hypothetical protein